MKKLLINLVLVGVFYTSVYGEQAFLSEKKIVLNDRELHSLKLAKSWLDNDIKSIKGQDGSITYIYGSTMPLIIVSPLRFTDIQLQPGEIIRDMQSGDTVRWHIKPAISGTAPMEVSHVMVKPTDIGLETTLAVMTDRRTYHFNLKSSKRRYLPIVNFHYKEDINAEWDMYKRYVNKKNEATNFKTVPGGMVSNIDSLNFKYTITGNYSWKPTRVYNDGVKTYIQMPKSMKFNEAPILMVLDSNSNKQLVNYRLKNDRYVVDKLFNEAVLIIGVGGDQEKVLIQKNSKVASNALSVFNLSSNEEEY